MDHTRTVVDGKQADDPRPEDDGQDLATWINFADKEGNTGVDAYDLTPFFLGTDDAPNEAGRKWLADTLAAQVCSDTMAGWDASEEYRTKRKQNNQMLTGFLPKKVFPFDGCANAHIPLMFERILRLSANVYAEIFLDRDTIFAVKPTGPADYEESEILSVHGNWQLRNELTDFLPQQDAGVQEFFSAGSVFCHSWYDPVQHRNRHDILTCDEFVLPYVGKTVMVDLSDVPWKTRLIRKYKNELEVLGDQGDWSQVPIVLKEKPPQYDALETKSRDAGAKAEGITQSESAGTAGSYLFFEYHGFIRMPGEQRQRPICATVEANRKIVTKFYVREEEDWRDRMRFDRQTSELQRYQGDMAQHQQDQMSFLQTQQMEQQLHAHLAAPHVDPGEAAMVAQAVQSEPISPPVAPMPPVWLDPTEGAPESVRRIPVEMFAHGRCINNPSGMLGLSIGTILADLNRLSDESLNRYYDSATFANVWSAIIDDSLKLKGSTLAVKPGTLIRVQNAGGNIKDKILELRAGQANPQMLDMVRIAGENADSAVAAPGVLSGEPGKSGETFRGIASRREMATKQLSAAGIKYLAFLEQILKNNARLNSLFLPEEEVIAVAGQFQDTRKHTLDEQGQPKPELVVNRDLYRRSYAVSFSADVRFTSQAQRISEADEVLAMVTNLPPLQANPSFVYAAVADALRARGKQDLIPLLGHAPPPPSQPFGTPPPPPPGAMPPGAGGPPPPGALPSGAPPR